MSIDQRTPERKVADQRLREMAAKWAAWVDLHHPYSASPEERELIEAVRDMEELDHREAEDRDIAARKERAADDGPREGRGRRWQAADGVGPFGQAGGGLLGHGYRTAGAGK